MTNLPESTELQQVNQYAPQGSVSIFNGGPAFDNAQRMAIMLSKAKMVPKAYQGAEAIPDILVCMELAHRMNESPLMIMQNVHVINGRPSFASNFLIGKVNNTGKYTSLEFDVQNLGTKKVDYEETVWESGQKRKIKKSIEIENISCVAFATNIASGREVKSPKFTIEIAVKEGWYTKDGSKWPTMPELMLSYRCASAFANLYAPEVKLGIPTKEEVEDIEYLDITPNKRKGQQSVGQQSSIIDAMNAKVTPIEEADTISEQATAEEQPPAEASEPEDDGMI